MKPAVGPRVLDSFVLLYIDAVLWCSYDDDRSEHTNEPLSIEYSIDDLSPETLERIKADCNLFLSKVISLIDNYDLTYIAQNFWV